MSELTRDTTRAAPGGLSCTVGPGSGLSRVLECFELAGREDPAVAWNTFTGTWNWAAPLGPALSADDAGVDSVVRRVPGGFSLSGRWRRPPGARPEWLVVSVVPDRQRGAAGTSEHEPDLFVVAAKALRVTDGTPVTTSVFELTDFYVPAGLATHTTGTALEPDDEGFFRTAVTAMALGAARRLTEALAALDPSCEPAVIPAGRAPAASTAELDAVLHDARSALAAALHGIPETEGVNARPFTQTPAAVHLERAGQVARHVVTAAYERALPLPARHDGHPLVRLVEDASPILQCMRFDVELMPRHSDIPTRKTQIR